MASSSSTPLCPTRDYETMFNTKAYINEYYVISKETPPSEVSGSLQTFIDFWYNHFATSKFII